MNRNQSGYRGPRGGWLRAQFNRRPKPVWMLVVMDVALIGLSLVVFALFHHVLPRHEASVGKVSTRPTSQVVAVAPTQAPAQAAEDGDEDIDAPDAPTPTTAGAVVGDLFANLTTGDFSQRFADKFTSGQVIASASGYQSANVNVRLDRVNNGTAVYYVADIYVRDISYFVTAFAKDTFGKGLREWATDINRRVNAVISINGDYYGGRSDGIVIRNGELFREDPYPVRDVCVLYWDGRMETFEAGRFDADAQIDAGAYQAWNFGPMLLDADGQAMTAFNSDVGPSNPRTALGYFEPGHYCFVVVDGRQEGSSGLKLRELSALMAELGCVRAYNMDGGNTSVMVAGNNEIVNNPSGGGRPTSDIIAIVDSN